MLGGCAFLADEFVSLDRPAPAPAAEPGTAGRP
jgi:hypothetical protein